MQSTQDYEPKLTTNMKEDITFRARFDTFHAENPHVYDLIVEESLAVLNTGQDKWSINGVFEVLRWKRFFSTTGDEYKMNNNWRSFYARMVSENVPELSDFFSIRTQPTQVE